MQNEIVAFITYAKVKAVDGDTVTVADCSDGRPFKVEGEELLNKALSADQFAGEQRICKAVLVEKLTHSNGRPFTVRFQKANGDPRTLRGYFVKEDAGFGRSNVIDLDLPTDWTHKLRQVDHRTIEYLILDGIKYTH